MSNNLLSIYLILLVFYFQTKVVAAEVTGYYRVDEENYTFLLPADYENRQIILEEIQRKQIQPTDVLMHMGDSDIRHPADPPSETHMKLYYQHGDKIVPVYILRNKVSPIDHHAFHKPLCLKQYSNNLEIYLDNSQGLKIPPHNLKHNPICKKYRNEIQQEQDKSLKVNEELKAYFECYQAFENGKFTTDYQQNYKKYYTHYFDRASKAFGVPKPILTCLSFRESDHWKTGHKENEDKNGLMQIVDNTRTEIHNAFQDEDNKKAQYGLDIYNSLKLIKGNCEGRTLNAFDASGFSKEEQKGDPEKSLVAGAYYLSYLKNGVGKKLLNQVKSSEGDSGISIEAQTWMLAVVMYNRGYSGFKKILKKYGTGDLDQQVLSVDYVKRVLKKCVKKERSNQSQGKREEFYGCEEALNQLESVKNCALAESALPMSGDENRANVGASGGCHETLSINLPTLRKKALSE